MFFSTQDQLVGSLVRLEQMNNYKAAFTGWLQVALVAMNTYQIANRHIVGAIIVGFLISLVWTFNIRSALGCWSERLSYCLGATIGTATGLYLSSLIYMN
jgi:hypothetical protein